MSDGVADSPPLEAYISGTMKSLGSEHDLRSEAKPRLDRLKKQIGDRAEYAVTPACIAPPPFPFTAVTAAASVFQYPRRRAQKQGKPGPAQARSRASEAPPRTRRQGASCGLRYCRLKRAGGYDPLTLNASIHIHAPAEAASWFPVTTIISVCAPGLSPLIVRTFDCCFSAGE